MKAGKGLDVLVARAFGFQFDESLCLICGWDMDGPFGGECTPDHCVRGSSPEDWCDYIPEISTDFADASALVENLNLGMELIRRPRRGAVLPEILADWECRLRRVHGELVAIGNASSGPHVISLALLELKGVEVPNG